MVISQQNSQPVLHLTKTDWLTPVQCAVRKQWCTDIRLHLVQDIRMEWVYLKRPIVQVDFQRQVKLWTVFGLAFKSTTKNQNRCWYRNGWRINELRHLRVKCKLHRFCLLCLLRMQNRQTLCCAVNILKVVTSSCNGEQLTRTAIIGITFWECVYRLNRC